MGRRNGIHGPYSDTVVLSHVSPLSTGTSGAAIVGNKGLYGSNQLANGQIALTWDKPTRNGLEVVTNGADSRFLQDKSDRRFYIEVGTGVNSNAGGMTSKNIRSVGFRPEDVLEVNWSQSKPASQAEVILGYDGFDTSKGITLKPGEAATISLRLKGMPLAFYGRKDGIFEGTFSMQMPETDDCNDNCLDGACYDMVNTVIDEILEHQMVEGIPLSTFIHAYPVSDCFEDVCDYRSAYIYRVTVQDRGDDEALGRVWGGLNDNYTGITRVIRTAYNSDAVTSTYEILSETDEGATLGFDLLTPNLTDPQCGQDDCDALGGTYYAEVWFVDIAGDIDQATADAFYAAVAAASGAAFLNGNAVDGGQEYGTEKWWGIFDGEVTQADIDTAIAGGAGAYDTVKLEEIKVIDDFCELDPVSYTANLYTTCTIGRKLFFIDLKDDDCGNTRLEDLQASFPELTITEQQEGEVLKVSSPTWDPALSDGCDNDGTYASNEGPSFDVTFNTDGSINCLEPTAPIVGASVGDTYTIPGATLGECAQDLVIVVDIVGVGPANCRRRYQAWVESEIKCADPCYMELYKFEAPGESLGADPSVQTSTFEFTRWQAHQFKNTDTTCNCGIAFKAKDLELCPPKEIADQIGVINKQIKIEVSGGELLGTKIGYPYNLKPFEVTYIQRAFDGTGWGENYMDAEKATYDRYLSYLAGDNYAQRWFKNTTTKLEPCVQYDTFQVKLRSSKHSQSFSGRKQETFRYIFVVPKGSYQNFAPFFTLLTSGNPAANSLPSA